MVTSRRSWLRNNPSVTFCMTVAIALQPVEVKPVDFTAQSSSIVQIRLSLSTCFCFGLCITQRQHAVHVFLTEVCGSLFDV